MFEMIQIILKQKEMIYMLVSFWFKTVPIDFKKVGDIVSKEVHKVQQTKYKVNNLEKKNPVTTLIHINQNNTDKQSLEKKSRC